MADSALEPMANQVVKKTLRVVVFQEDGLWVGQCLEHDITSRAISLPALREEIELAVCATVAIAQELGREPFEGIARAPQRFWDMFEHAATNLDEAKPAKRRSSSRRTVSRPVHPTFRLFEPVAA
jgi:hypothetical protein